MPSAPLCDNAGAFPDIAFAPLELLGMEALEDMEMPENKSKGSEPWGTAAAPGGAASRTVMNGSLLAEYERIKEAPPPLIPGGVILEAVEAAALDASEPCGALSACAMWTHPPPR